MSDYVTLPAEWVINGVMRSVPDWMHPAPNPFGVLYEGSLGDEICDDLVACIEGDDTYQVQRCGAVTRQYERSTSHLEALGPLTRLTHRTNNDWWKYIIDPKPTAWLQSYDRGGDYKAHQDNAPGHSRKLSAVAMVSDPDDYDGGDLTIRAISEVGEYVVPRTRGTVVVFQPWLVHDVSEVTAGIRRTVNLGFWGPPLR